MSTKRTSRRTWAQRLTLLALIVGAVACFGTAAALASGQWVLSNRKLIELPDPVASPDRGAGTDVVVMPGDPAPTTTDPNAADATFALAEPQAANFLIAGADNGSCGPDLTGTIGERGDLGERSDTIMIWRVNPDTNQVAVLSLPRDLYVEIPGSGRGRINGAYRRNDPTRLIQTIDDNFGVPIDHYVQVDFCAFERLVNAVGGVTVPFEYPARDKSSGLDIPTAGCVNLDGTSALAYVRSRHYQYEDPPGSGNWRSDGTSDFGRIARQQDFLRRVVARVIDDGLYDPGVATALLETNSDYLVTDSGLTVNRMLEFANTLRSIDPTAITTYRIASRNSNERGQSVEIPQINGDNMQAILAVFRGQARLADAPEQVTAGDTAVTTTTAVPETTDDETSSDGTLTTTTLPTVEAEENNTGIAPDPAATC